MEMLYSSQLSGSDFFQTFLSLFKFLNFPDFLCTLFSIWSHEKCPQIQTNKTGSLFCDFKLTITSNAKYIARDVFMQKKVYA